MRIVALSTSSGTGSVALWRDGRILAERTFPSGILHGQALLPSLAGLFEEQGWGRREFDRVAVDVGPGSYTGCRVGLAAAKVLAREARAGLTGVPSLAAVAWQAEAARGARVSVVLNARRERAYAALYLVSATAEPLVPPAVVPVSLWAKETSADLWTGDALAAYPGIFAGLPRAPEAAWRPRAGSVAHLAAATDRQDDPYALAPLYLAPTEAEEKFGAAR